ncbi:Saccharopine dehydrogenase [Conidiobolus coronatus NRRL 28638]|uniref:Saccharopine dehydrogenase n=1 Tax=Conidiobolus coronatus (strain ATCC 28846 / CBS 209.66 / NRRL 28638) TaxID=796925 RepID=A0A137P552_CONC2|nr:Saccharopine dehydrogenase [Conidiobolus coronatus NRRL 28638]|eukprot:KXN70133.1 Saccharopine dehydrogenase [Conidiobolus coronatus NRRL 28638]
MSNFNQKLNDKAWMIYGANGYTGELIAREAVKRGLKPVLAGRNKQKNLELALELKLEAKVFDLADTDFAAQQIKGNSLVMHCAGPFSATSKPMIEACLKAQAHYLDITGEITVFEQTHSFHQQAINAGVVLCSGVGFDVIPTDCVAAALKAALPDATHLALGFDSETNLSPGTAKTNIEGMANGGKVRQDGKIITVPLAHQVRQIDFGNGEKSAMTIPWGDVSTAFYTTGIPNIEVFIPASSAIVVGAKFMNCLRPLMKLTSVQNLIKNYLGKTVQGPEEDVRDQLPTFVWGEARNAKGEMKTARVRTANTYSLTITGSLAVIDYLMNHQPEGGAYTPANLISAELVSQLPESTAIQIS